MVVPPSTKSDLRFSLDPVGVINEPQQTLHPKLKQIFLQKMLVERKHVSDFEQSLKEIDLSIYIPDLKLDSRFGFFAQVDFTIGKIEVQKLVLDRIVSLRTENAVMLNSEGANKKYIAGYQRVWSTNLPLVHILKQHLYCNVLKDKLLFDIFLSPTYPNIF